MAKTKVEWYKYKLRVFYPQNANKHFDCGEIQYIDLIEDVEILLLFHKLLSWSLLVNGLN